jgi:hypothetical protein
MGLRVDLESFTLKIEDLIQKEAFTRAVLASYRDKGQ